LQLPSEKSEHTFKTHFMNTSEMRPGAKLPGIASQIDPFALAAIDEMSSSYRVFPIAKKGSQVERIFFLAQE